MLTKNQITVLGRLGVWLRSECIGIKPHHIRCKDGMEFVIPHASPADAVWWLADILVNDTYDMAADGVKLEYYKKLFLNTLEA